MLFSEGDFIIITPEAVKGIIEVKTKIRSYQDLKDVIRDVNETGRFIFKGKKNRNKPIFNGIFSYEYERSENIACERLADSVRAVIDEFLTSDNEARDYVVNHISLNKDIFIKYWRFRDRVSIYYGHNLRNSYSRSQDQLEEQRTFSYLSFSYFQLDLLCD